tara:strand:- start:5529 stop:11807 length:6279 start_codon:yes stop_codon:yes gene_type:complete
MPAFTDFNVSPYYDDFSRSKNFHRVLFRPAFAVQARELSQSQSILQSQIEHFGDHVFKQGAMVRPGQVSLDTDVGAIKLTSKTASSLSTYNNTTITGGSSGVVAEVFAVDTVTSSDPDTLYVKYVKTGTNNTATVFTDGETITSTATDSPTAVVASTHTGSSASVVAGNYYFNGFFIENSAETIILDKYTNTPSYRIGFTVAESFVTPSDDSSLNDNAIGSSNLSAPGAHRLKIQLTLTKKTLSSTEDATFFEIARIENGQIKKLVRSTEYNVFEETLARRTSDESGDYTLNIMRAEAREHLSSGNNRGIFTSANGGLETKFVLAFEPFKAYVSGFETSRIGTTFVEFDKTRVFDTEQNYPTRYDTGNFIKVNNIHGQPDITFVSGDVESFKAVSLFDTKSSSRGTTQSTTGVTVPQIGRAKSRGFEYVAGTETNDIFTTDSSTIFKHYLFDIEMFTRISLTTSVNFTNGETVSGASGGATGIVQSVTAKKSTAVTSITASGTDIEGAFSTAVVTLANHGFVDGQQVTFSGGDYAVDSVTITDDTVYCVKNTTANTFELFDASGSTGVNVTSFSSGPTVSHTVLVLSNVQGLFSIGEVVSGQTSELSGTIQNNRYGYKGVRLSAMEDVKQVAMAGSPVYTADVDLTSTHGTNTDLNGTVTGANSGSTLTGKGTLFTEQLKPGDQVAFTNDAGTEVTRIVKFIDSNNSLTFTSALGSSDVTTNSPVTRQRGKINEPEKNISIYKLPFVAVKTLKTTANSLTTDTNFKVRRNFTGTLSSNGDISITTGTNETFASLANLDYSVTIMSTGAGSTGSVGDILNLSGNNHEGDAIFTLSGSPTGRTLTLDFGANFNGHKVKILATVTRSVAPSKTKTLNSNQTLAISSQTTIEEGVISLGKADIFALDSVHMATDFSTDATSSDTDITERFELDNGQRDNYYDIGRIKLKPGKQRPTGRLLIQFDFFAHGTGDYFDVDSYSGVVDYEDIPSYTSDTTDETFELRDSLDFRPRVDDATTINSGGVDRTYDGSGASDVDVVKFGSDVTADFEYFLPRIDKVFLTRSGELKVSKGAPAIDPELPEVLNGNLTIANVFIRPYLFDVSKDITISYQDTKRYTMRDIGALEQRISNTEYYTQLSLLEVDAKQLQIQDANGLDRFKNGFLVDNFTGHDIGDVGNNDYKFAVDRAVGEGRGLYFSEGTDLEEVDDDGSAIVAADRTDANYVKTGDLITLPFTEATFIENPFATTTENLNPFLIFNWIGNVTLDPPIDEWKDVNRVPDLVVNRRGEFDNMVIGRGLDNESTNEIPLGTEWNEWQTTWTGQGSIISQQTVGLFTETRVNMIDRQTRTGIRSIAVPQTVLTSQGDKTLSSVLIPFIRARDISFTAEGMRPNTRVFPFFDNIDVSANVTPTDGVAGGSILTNANGKASGVFSIPDPNNNSNPRFRTGTRVFRLTSSSTNSEDKTAVATSAEADYFAKGILDTVQETIISTREVSFRREQVTENRQRTRIDTITRNRDPLAQSFYVDEAGGLFVTSVDIFFATKSDTIPVKCEIRNMINGYPGTSIVPFSTKYLNPSDISTSTDGNTATTFTFPSPVYLKEGLEYCVILYSDSTDYTVYISRLGDRVIGGDRVVSKQPDSGVLFKSANYRTWSPEQMEDLKYVMKKAVFDTSASATVTIANKAVPTKTLSANALKTFNGTSLIKVTHKNHGMLSTSDNVTISNVASGTYNGISNSDINGTYTSISNIDLDSYFITSSGTANATGDVGGTTITATQNRLFDVLQLQIGHLIFPDNTFSTTLRTTTGKSLHGTETPFQLTTSTDSRTVSLQDNIYFTAPRILASSINETNELSSATNNKSLLINISMGSSNANLSPVIDTKRFTAFTISNRVNNPTVSNTDTFSGDGSTTAFSLSATPDNEHIMQVKKNGKILQPVDDYTVSGTTLTLDTAPGDGARVVAKITNMTDFRDDTDPVGGSSSGSYLNKPISLENPATSIDVRVGASVRSTSSIKAFFRVSGGEESRRIQDIEFTPFNTTGVSDTTITPTNSFDRKESQLGDFREHKFSVDNLEEFSSFQIKLVFNGTVSSYPVKVKDFRAIALA